MVILKSITVRLIPVANTRHYMYLFNKRQGETVYMVMIIYSP